MRHPRLREPLHRPAHAGGVRAPAGRGDAPLTALRAGVVQRLLCDEMLGGLARRLRAAGHEAATAGRGEPDRELIRRAVGEDRTLLTRDRRLGVDRPAAARVLVLPEGGDAQARTLRDALGLDWLAAPFSRCMIDDTPVVPATAGEAAALPPDLQGLSPVHRCPACGRLYWAGGHVTRMRAELARLAALPPLAT